MFALGLIALPDMITGHILSCASQIAAANYKIVVICVIFGSTGLSTTCFLALTKSIFYKIINNG